MKCANPNCNSDLLYFRGGVLRLLEMECDPSTRLRGHGDGFPVCRPSARYFWLCPDCARVLAIKRWTSEGLVLESLPGAGGPKPQVYKVQPVPAVESPKPGFHFHRTIARTV